MGKDDSLPSKWNNISIHKLYSVFARVHLHLYIFNMRLSCGGTGAGQPGHFEESWRIEGDPNCDPFSSISRSPHDLCLHFGIGVQRCCSACFTNLALIILINWMPNQMWNLCKCTYIHNHTYAILIQFICVIIAWSCRSSADAQQPGSCAQHTSKASDIKPVAFTGRYFCCAQPFFPFPILGKSWLCSRANFKRTKAWHIARQGRKWAKMQMIHCVSGIEGDPLEIPPRFALISISA